MFGLSKAIQSVQQWRAGKFSSSSPPIEVAAWAADHAISFSGSNTKSHYLLAGQVDGRPWTLERRRSSRSFIKGDELNARAVLNVLVHPVVIVMNRPLKNALEKQAYEIYTDSVQTLAKPSLVEEMRWIALYPECVRLNLSQDFQQGFSVLAGNLIDAEKWVSHELAQLILTCQAGRLDAPFILMLLRGKVYLQLELEITPDETPVIERSLDIFQMASKVALQQFAKPIL